jgi:cell division protein FtsL
MQAVGAAFKLHVASLIKSERSAEAAKRPALEIEWRGGN